MPTARSVDPAKQLTGLARFSFYADPSSKPVDMAIIEEIRAIAPEFEGYGHRRGDADLRHRDMVVNSRKAQRPMKENDLDPRGRWRFVHTSDIDHRNPICPFIARGVEVHGLDRLWVADLTSINIAEGFSCAPLDHCS